MDFLWIYVVFCFLLFAFAIYVTVKEKKAETDFVYAARSVRAGMSKQDVIFILGSDYSYSLLKNGIEKLEWRYRKKGHSYRVAKGVRAHQSGYTRRISVKFKDGVVIEINSLNMD